MKAGSERLLAISFTIAFALMILVQAALTSPAVRAALSLHDELEGKPLGMDEYLYSEGHIVLEVRNTISTPDLKVLVNGRETAAFSTRSVEVRVRDGDVVEIDGSALDTVAEVVIIQKSDNIKPQCLNKSVRVDGNVMRLVRLRVK